MNTVSLLGRLTGDPETRDASSTVVSSFTLAVNRGKDEADFIRCVSFGKTAEFVRKYLAKGVKIAVTGSIRTGSYVDRDGRKVYTTDVVVNNVEFAEAKRQTPETWEDVDITGTPFA